MYICMYDAIFNVIYVMREGICVDRNPLRWRHDEHDIISNHQPHHCLLNHLFRRRSKKTSKLRVTGLCVGNSPGTGVFPAQMASNAENVSIWWRHHALKIRQLLHGVKVYACLLITYTGIVPHLFIVSFPMNFLLSHETETKKCVNDSCMCCHVENPHNRHPVASPWGWYMGCLLWYIWFTFCH